MSETFSNPEPANNPDSSNRKFLLSNLNIVGPIESLGNPYFQKYIPEIEQLSQGLSPEADVLYTQAIDENVNRYINDETEPHQAFVNENGIVLVNAFDAQGRIVRQQSFETLPNGSLKKFITYDIYHWTDDELGELSLVLPYMIGDGNQLKVIGNETIYRNLSSKTNDYSSQNIRNQGYLRWLLTTEGTIVENSFKYHEDEQSSTVHEYFGMSGDQLTFTLTDTTIQAKSNQLTEDGKPAWESKLHYKAFEPDMPRIIFREHLSRVDEEPSKQRNVVEQISFPGESISLSQLLAHVSEKPLMQLPEYATKYLQMSLITDISEDQVSAQLIINNEKRNTIELSTASKDLAQKILYNNQTFLMRSSVDQQQMIYIEDIHVFKESIAYGSEKIVGVALLQNTALEVDQLVYIIDSDDVLPLGTQLKHVELSNLEQTLLHNYLDNDAYKIYEKDESTWLIVSPNKEADTIAYDFFELDKKGFSEYVDCFKPIDVDSILVGTLFAEYRLGLSEIDLDTIQILVSDNEEQPEYLLIYSNNEEQDVPVIMLNHDDMQWYRSLSEKKISLSHSESELVKSMLQIPEDSAVYVIPDPESQYCKVLVVYGEQQTLLSTREITLEDLTELRSHWVDPELQSWDEVLDASGLDSNQIALN